jgi:hypothetical protein
MVLDRQRDDLRSLVAHSQKGVVVGRFLKNRQPRHGAIEYMKHFPAGQTGLSLAMIDAG